jgi:hypothetical protein
MSEDILMDEPSPTIYAHQPLEVNKDAWMLVTITHYDDPVAGDHTTQQFVMPYSSKTVTWVEGIKDLDVSVEYEPIEVKAAPKAVHVIITYENGVDTTACTIHASRWKKYHQSLDQAFHRVYEKPSCKSCIRAIKDTIWQAPLEAGTLQGAVLKQWSWDDVDEDYRPGGPKHHYLRTPS